MLKQTLLAISATAAALTSLANGPFDGDHSPLLPRHPHEHTISQAKTAKPTSAITAPWSPCLRQNPGCQEIFSLIQRCWNTGVPGRRNSFDPNDGGVSETFRTCFCGDQRTTGDDAWGRCAACVHDAGLRGGYVTRMNLDVVLFCSTPDPNLYLWLSSILNFTLIVAPNALSSAPSPVLTGPITVIVTASAVRSRYRPDPSANKLPSGIVVLTTATVSSLPSPTSTSVSTSSSSGRNSDGGGSGGAGAGGRNADPDNDGVLTILYFVNEGTSMYIVGPASEVGSLLPSPASASATATTAAESASASASASGVLATSTLPVAVTTPLEGQGGGSVTTATFVQGGRTVLIVGPATATAVGEKGSAGGVGLNGFGGWPVVVVGVVAGAAFLGGLVL